MLSSLNKDVIIIIVIPINFDFTVHSQLKKICVPKVTKSYIFIKKNYHKTSTQGNRIGVAPFLQGET